MDDLPLARRPQRPPPHRNTLTLLVGRITTIKLAYWAAVTAAELALGRLIPSGGQRLPVSVAVAALLGALTLGWAVVAARGVDRRLGGLYRSLPTVTTAFVAASVVASPASIPLLLIERQRSLESCGAAACGWAPVLIWVGVLVGGTILVPAAFALSMRGRSRS